MKKFIWVFTYKSDSIPEMTIRTEISSPSLMEARRHLLNYMKKLASEDKIPDISMMEPNVIEIISEPSHP